MENNKTTELEELIDQKYVPSALERKKAILMYFLLGIFITTINKKATMYEMFHLKQAMWLWTVLIAIFVSSLFMMFIPFVKVIPVFLLFFMLIFFVLFIKQAWEWYYTLNSDRTLLPIFYWIWGWIVDIFEIDSHDPLDETEKNKD